MIVVSLCLFVSVSPFASNPRVNLEAPLLHTPKYETETGDTFTTYPRPKHEAETQNPEPVPEHRKRIPNPETDSYPETDPEIDSRN